MIRILKKRMPVLIAAIFVILLSILTAVPARAGGTAVRLNRSACTLNVGETLTLKVSISKKSLKTKRVAFTSNQPAVASVTQKGKVTARKTGTARITAAVAGTDFRASCKVAVKNSQEQAVTGNLVTVSFPEDLSERNENNAAVFDIDTFSLSFELPDGWAVDPAADLRTYDCPGLFSKAGIRNEKGILAGIVGYNIYDGAEDDPRVVYNQIALGNHYQFDVRDSYKVVKAAPAGITARCTVYRSAQMTGGSEAANHGIVSCNKELGVYIAMELFSGGNSDDQMTGIAESVRIWKAGDGTSTN